MVAGDRHGLARIDVLRIWHGDVAPAHWSRASEWRSIHSRSCAATRISGTQNGSSLVVADTDDLVVTLDAANPTDPTFVLCNASGIVCGDQTGNAAYAATGYAATVDPSSIFLIAAAQSSTGVPEPVSIALLGTALAGLAVRRRKRQTV